MDSRLEDKDNQEKKNCYYHKDGHHNLRESNPWRFDTKDDVKDTVLFYRV